MTNTITTEDIEKIAATLAEEDELLLSELQTIIKAARKDIFWAIYLAYAYGFHRGQTAGREAVA